MIFSTRQVKLFLVQGYLVARKNECALMSSPWQSRVTSALSLSLRSSASWAMKWLLSKLMLWDSLVSESVFLQQEFWVLI